jgi:ferric-dicitrate binding protein FerR (iron transport regulator)
MHRANNAAGVFAMSLDPKKQVELELILARMSDGESTGDERQRLNDLLEGDFDACEVYLDTLALESQLIFEGQDYPPLAVPTLVKLKEGVADRSVSRGRTYWLKAASVLAASVCALATWLAWPKNSADIPIHEIGAVLLTDHCEWRSPSTIAEGSRLKPSELNLLRGLAIVRLDGGAEIILRDASSIRLISAVQASLNHGQVSVRAASDGLDFQLTTAAGTLTDGKSEFAVKVGQDGRTELQVLSGEVTYLPRNAAEQPIVHKAGDPLVLDNTGSGQRLVSLKAIGFGELVKIADSGPRHDLSTAYEGFDYPLGEHPINSLSQGRGWLEAWRLRQGEEVQHPWKPDDSNQMKIVEGPDVLPWPVAGTSHSMLEMPEGQSVRLRQFDKPIDLTKSATHYFSLITVEPRHEQRQRGSRLHEGIRLTFRSSQNYWRGDLSFGLSENLFPRIACLDFGTFHSAAAIPDEQSLLWIGKIVCRADADDEAFFRIYGQADPLDYAEPLSWHAVSRGLRLDNRLDLVVISSSGQSSRLIDDLRIGPTWRSVVPTTTKGIE